VPALQDDVPDTVYPELHVGWQVDPLARESVQSPTPPFEGAPEASQGFAAHVAIVSVPALQDDVPDTVYPELHVGWQVDPLARESAQSPTPPFEGAPEASHVSMTDTGVELEVWLPSPSCPLSLLPQHFANSSVSRAHEW